MIYHIEIKRNVCKALLELGHYHATCNVRIGATTDMLVSDTQVEYGQDKQQRQPIPPTGRQLPRDLRNS